MPPISESYRQKYIAEYESERQKRGVEWGQCFCGCGGITTVADSTDLSNRKLAGHPRWWLCGHATKISGPDYEVKDCGYKTPCWMWRKGSHETRYGARYGTVRRPGEEVPISAQRYMWEKLRGPVPPNMDLDHLCRVTLCCNPDHIEPVPHVINVRRGKNTRLSLETAREIRALRAAGVDTIELSARFGVHRMYIYQICRGDKWKEHDHATM